MGGDTHTRGVVGGTAALAAGIIVASVAARGADSDGWLLAARYTARWSFVVFLAAYLAPVLPRGFGEARTRTAILAFGAVHGIHLGALVTYRVVAGETPPVQALAVGGLAYALIAVLVGAEAARRSGRVLRAAAMNYALLVFVLTYASRLESPEQYWVGVMGVAVGGAALLSRGFVAVRNRASQRNLQSVP